jgi:sec-independent protein translocase protein TatA
MPFGGFHWFELIPLVLIAVLIFGPKKLPELGSSIGKTIKEFQKSMREVTEKPEKPEEPLAPPQLTAGPMPELSAPTVSSTPPPSDQAPA